MRWLIVGLVLLGTCSVPTAADPDNLSGGALITHYDPDYHGRWWGCHWYDYAPLTNCDQQTNSIWDGHVRTWFVVAAFSEDKEWCAVQFGLGDFEPDMWYFSISEPCFPELGGGIIIESPGWPGPGEGITIIATESPWQGNWLPVYGFDGYVYNYYAGVVQLVPDPTVEEPFGGFRNCANPPQQWDAALGGMGMYESGTWVCWGPGERVCCVGVECVIVQSEEECADLGGEYLPDWQDCGPPNPCDVTPTFPTNWGRLKALYR